VVDEVRVLRLLRAITDDLSVLRHESDADDEHRADPLWLRGVKKYTFVTAIEARVTSQQSDTTGARRSDRPGAA
jgi:hypothetical protein